jgi:hypothetical protein
MTAPLGLALTGHFQGKELLMTVIGADGGYLKNLFTFLDLCPLVGPFHTGHLNCFGHWDSCKCDINRDKRNVYIELYPLAVFETLQTSLLEDEKLCGSEWGQPLNHMAAATPSLIQQPMTDA